MKTRYTVIELGKDEHYYAIEDNNCQMFHCPKFATTQFFMSKESAQTVADILNKEWQAFLTKPY